MMLTELQHTKAGSHEGHMSCTHNKTVQELDIHIVEGALNLGKQ
jgi:hypothetical protein